MPIHSILPPEAYLPAGEAVEETPHKITEKGMERNETQKGTERTEPPKKYGGLTVGARR